MTRVGGVGRPSLRDCKLGGLFLWAYSLAFELYCRCVASQTFKLYDPYKVFRVCVCSMARVVLRQCKHVHKWMNPPNVFCRPDDIFSACATDSLGHLLPLSTRQ